MQNEIKTIQKQISDIFDEDQKIRKNPHSSIDEIRQYENVITTFLKNVVEKYGWITVSLFGEDSSYKAGILATHTQDKAFAKKCLDLMQDNLNDIDKTNFAIVYDKVMLSAGKPQRYGTKLKSYFDKNGQVVTEVVSLEDPQNVSKYREELGLPPLEEYIKNSEKLFLLVSGKQG